MKSCFHLFWPMLNSLTSFDLSVASEGVVRHPFFDIASTALPTRICTPFFPAAMICRCISELADWAACTTSYAWADGNHCVDWTLLQKLKYSAGWSAFCSIGGWYNRHWRLWRRDVIGLEQVTGIMSISKNLLLFTVRYFLFSFIELTSEWRLDKPLMYCSGTMLGSDL